MATDKYGKWTVLEIFSSLKGKIGKCQCECGSLSEVPMVSLRAKRSTQCKQCANAFRYRAKQYDHSKWIGHRFGKLSVIGLGTMTRDGQSYICICDCGKSKEYSASKLKASKIMQCLSCSNSQKSTKHGFHLYPEYKIWGAIKLRCRNPKNAGYKDYGARGIDIYEPWYKDFESFIKYIGFRPAKGFTLDRIDNDQGYVPGNLRWVPMLVNANNTRRNIYYEKDGIKYTARELATKFNVVYHRMNWCLIRYGINWVFNNIDKVREVKKKI